MYFTQNNCTISWTDLRIAIQAGWVYANGQLTHRTRGRVGSMCRDGYWNITVGGFTIGEHRAIWLLFKGYLPPKGSVVEHINQRPMDNRIENLREATQTENTYNRSVNKGRKYKGVRQDKRSRKFEARLTKNYKTYALGSYDTAEEAAMAYNKAAPEYFGEHASLNTIEGLNEQTSAKS